jgi:cysteine desulfurase family protein (TIGR01976 family)
MAATAFDVEAVRARYAALDGPLAFFDGPGGTQVPDEVVDAISAHFREANANSGGAFATSRATDALLTNARLAAAGFLGCDQEDVAFGANMTTLNFALTRALARELRPGDEILVTKLDHDANVSPWLQLRDDVGVRVQFVDVHDDTTLDLDDLRRRLSDRTRVVAFPWASNGVGTVQDVAAITALAHEVGALAWVDAVHYAPHGPIDVFAAGADVLFCSPYKFFGPHLGLAFGRRELLESWRPYKVRPAPDAPVGARYETGTPPFELLAGFVAAVDYLGSLGWDAITAHERALGQRFLDGLPAGCTLHGLPTMEGRVPTFALSVEGRGTEAVATELDERGFAVWHGDYYAVEIMRRLGLEPEGAVRVGIVHYNTADEVDRLLEALGSL